MKRAVLYLRVSTLDQHPENQALDLRSMARQRGFEIVREFVDHGVSGARARRPGLDQLLAEARRGKFDVVLVWGCDRLARRVKHFLEVLDELNRLNIEFLSYREAIDTSGALGHALLTIISVVAELERNLLIERVRSGMRRAKLDGIHIGRRPVEVDSAAIVHDRNRGDSLRQIAKTHKISRATVCRVLQHSGGWSQRPENRPPQTLDFTGDDTSV
jgi:DNA invertase Pin-like site-specific DNA recombinase